MESTLNRHPADDSYGGVMPHLKALIQYINERKVQEDGAVGYSFVRGLEPNIRDTYFALFCLKSLKVSLPGHELVKFISSYQSFSLNGAYYASKSLEQIGAKVQFQDGMLMWRHHGTEEARHCEIPPTPITSYLKYNIYGMYGSSIFSSPLSSVLKLIELGAAKTSSALANSIYAFIKPGSHRDIMILYICMEILAAMRDQGHPARLRPSDSKEIEGFLQRCTTRKGYLATPNAISPTLYSTYAGHSIAVHCHISDPQGTISFIDSLQNPNGGFRLTPFGGISTLESCYLAMSIICDNRSS
jgi:hypothetical protein